MSTALTPRRNHLLAALPAADYPARTAGLELIPLPLGWAVYEAGRKQGYVYFPTDSIISLLYVMEDGASAEIAIVGNDGVVGVSLFMGGETTPSRAVVQSPGTLTDCQASLLKQEFDRDGSAAALLLRYTQSLITQMAQTAVCNRHHSVEQQLCRWLLLRLDRLSSNEAHNDPGADRQHARCAPGRRHGGGWRLQTAGMIRYTAARSPCSTG